jgi:hypothetical protein
MVATRPVRWHHYWGWVFTPSTIGKAVLSRRCTAGEFARKKGILEASQETPTGPWWHRVTPSVLQTLRSKIRRVPVKSE